MTISLTDILKGWKGSEDFKDLTWHGSFDDYLKMIKVQPKITRNAYQRMYDMILEHGSSEYVDTKKKISRYHFFDDLENDGKDGVFDFWLCMHVFKSQSLGGFHQTSQVFVEGQNFAPVHSQSFPTGISSLNRGVPGVDGSHFSGNNTSLSDTFGTHINE